MDLNSIKSGKVVVLLNGRYAGRKAIVVKTFDEGHGSRKFGHAIGTYYWIDAKQLSSLLIHISVAGVDRYPRRVTKSMDKQVIKKRSKIKPFVKFVNYNHVMPTRYVVDIDLKKVLDDGAMNQPETRVECRKTIKKVFEDR